MRYFIYLQYDGTNYHGWQTQPNCETVQETIEQKLSMLLRRPMTIIGAGRTDTGVHARQMVAHFSLSNGEALANATPTPTDEEEVPSTQVVDNVADEMTLESLGTNCEELAFKLNQVLPPDITVQRVVPVKWQAHARFSPISRTYRYYITTKKPLYKRDYVMRIFEPLDIELMNHACAKLFCYTDFTSFSKLHTDTKTNNCKIMEAIWQRVENDEVTYVFTIRADRFLRNMVRAIVGTLLQVGRHRMTIQEFANVIEQKDRCTAGDSVAARGLFLEEIEYPEDIFFNDEDES